MLFLQQWQHVPMMLQQGYRQYRKEFIILCLLAEQERLGAEFEEVLFDNLWDLYAR